MTELPFDQPNAAADLAYCAKMDLWTLEEAVALSFGKIPSIVSRSYMTQEGERFVPVAFVTSPFRVEYFQRCELIRRAIASGSLERHWKSNRDLWASTVKPDEFLAWAADLFDSLPEELVALVKARKAKHAQPTAEQSEEPELAAWQRWARQDLWSEAELSRLVIGCFPDRPLDDESLQIKVHAARETISRGVLSQTLAVVERSDLDQGSKLYGTARHFRPVEAVRWACSRFETLPSALTDAVAAALASDSSSDKLGKPLPPRLEAAYLNIIGSMLALMLGESPAGKPHSVFEDQTAIVDALVANFGSIDGISKRNLDGKFAQANQKLRSE
jgi:hypothetical protein